MDNMSKNNVLMRQNLDLIENERRELAHELHDEIGQNLTAIRTAAQLICRQSEGRQSFAVAQGIIGMTDQMFAIVHQILHRLRPSVLDKLGLNDALEELSLFMKEHMQLTCKLDMDADFSDLDMNLQLAMYRIVQESLTNAVRHGKASQAWVHLRQRGEVLQLIVGNNGSPLRDSQQALMQSKTSGIGLIGIYHRVQAWQGDMVLENANQGVQLRCTIPLAA